MKITKNENKNYKCSKYKGRLYLQDIIYYYKDYYHNDIILPNLTIISFFGVDSKKSTKSLS